MPNEVAKSATTSQNRDGLAGIVSIVFGEVDRSRFNWLPLTLANLARHTCAGWRMNVGFSIFSGSSRL